MRPGRSCRAVAYWSSGIPHPDSSFEGLAKATNAWQERLQAGLVRVINASDENMGHLEEEILQKTQELQRVALEEASQKKADLTPPVCPGCKNKLSRVTEGHERSYQTRFGRDLITAAGPLDAQWPCHAAHPNATGSKSQS